MNRPQATIDIGTNSVLLLIAERRGSEWRARDELLEITRLGKGVDGAGRLHRDSIARTVTALARYAEVIRDRGAELACAGATSAVRDALNREEFLVRAAEVLGKPVRVLTGEEEAETSLAAVTAEHEGEVLVVDIGGGSTEIVHGSRGAGVTARVSLDIGSVRLSERCIQGDPPTREDLERVHAVIAKALQRAPKDAPAADLVGTAGTVTTLAAVSAGIDPYDAERVHRSLLERATLESLNARLAALPLAERAKLPGLPAGRADVIVAGGAILAAIMAHYQRERLLVWDRGLRWGLLHRFAAGARG